MADIRQRGAEGFCLLGIKRFYKQTFNELFS